MTEMISEAEAELLLANLDAEVRKAVPELLPLDLYPSAQDWLDPVTVLDSIQAEIAEGVPVVRKVRVAESSEVDRVTGKPRPSQSTSAELTGSRPYTAVESLDLTTEALALVFVSPVQMASKVFSTLSKFSRTEIDLVEVKFAAKKEETSDPVLELDSATVDLARSVARPLAKELDKLSRSLTQKTRNISVEPEKN
ncbi:hypothetical protein ACC721_06625 [Rhizobium ruizarguesonis]|uniref:Uncharacterized protein n=1 Tax=Rhizobium ruizarguesonis TaxID=2081791 RepID=A0AAE4YTP6_9HYPH|nr:MULTISPECIES: hypothetical protein [Rhizobium]NEI50073.1 hypothetical protein [Rhizobium ruizarguesonis]TAU31127.1 hypothetical protein ELI47_08505 [Rhizobium ruizarguesonis]TBZ45145.1 hypothetical protein E0H44_17030 [Rhizobium leguminosarum bv. viciae]